MKKNSLFKGVSILGAVMLFASTVLPGLQVYADEPKTSAQWDVYALHALPANNGEIQENSKENGGNGTYTSADGSYTVAIDEDAKTITFSDITLKDPSAGTEGTASEGRPAGYVWLGARFVNGGTATQSVKIGENEMDDGYVWVGINADKVKQLVNAGTFTKEWTIDAYYDNVKTSYKMIIDLTNIEILDTDNSSLIKVENGVITSVNNKTTSWSVSAIHALPATKGETQIAEQSKENGGNGTYTTADGTYTVAISEEDKTITFSDITLKDPSAGTEGTASEGRPAGYVWFGARFYHPAAIINTAKFAGETVSSADLTNGYNDRWAGVSASKVQEWINAGILTKEISVKLSWDGSSTAEEEYKIIIDLRNIEILDTDANENKSLVKVVDGKIVELNVENSYTITFNTDGGTSIDSIKAIEGTAITAPANPTKNGYTFAGWDKTIPTTMPGNDMTITAKWNKNSSGGSSSGGGGSSKSTTKTTDTKATTGDNTTVDNTKNDNKVTDNNTNDNNGNTPAYNDKYSKEFNDAYQFAYKYGITTMDSIEKADMESPLTRIAMAKMLSQYAINVLGKTPDTNRVVPNFPDVDAKLDADYNNGVTLAYQLGIMGINIDNFRPFDYVTRAEFATALSRLLFNTPDGEGAYYETHLAKLMEEKIITNNNPDLQELRGYVMIMLMRSAQ